MYLPSLFRRAAVLAGFFVVSVPVLPALASHVRRGPTSPNSHHKLQGKVSSRVGSRGASSSRPRAIDDSRATEIQGALVKAGYLQSASGHWDEASADAMRKMQGDNGWQTKLIPDSRALIKLGLGANGGEASASSASATTSAE